MFDNVEIPYIDGTSKPVIDPKAIASDKKWFINDHCFVADKNNVLHFIGINNPYPDDHNDLETLYSYHPYLGHATTNEPFGTWEHRGFALDESAGTEYLGAPYIVWLDELEKYVMMFESKIDGTRALEIAYSNDLFTWERENKSILTELGWTKRDPCIIKENGKYLVYLCNPHKDGSTVSISETTDFKTFENTRICLSIKDGVHWGGIESPFVLKRNGLYYLFFTYAHRRYTETIVCVSDKCDEFSMDNVVTTLFGHASEIFSYNGVQYISSCGPEDMHMLNNQGLYLSKLAWLKK